MKSYIISLFYKKIILLTLLSLVSLATQADLKPVININQNGKILYDLSHPYTDTLDNIYVMETNQLGYSPPIFKKIIKLDTEGRLISEWSLRDSYLQANEFIGINSLNEILISKSSNQRIIIEKWSTDGVFLTSFELPSSNYNISSVLSFSDKIITYSKQGLLRIFNKDGVFLKEITKYQDFENPTISRSIANLNLTAINSKGQLLALTNKKSLITIDLNGKQLKPLLKKPIFLSKDNIDYIDLMYDDQNNIYASLASCSCLKKFDFNGKLLQTIGKRGSKPGQFLNTVLGSIDKDDNLILSDYYNHRIQKLQANGQALWTYGDQANYFLTPKALAVDSQHNIYVTDNGHHRIQKFSAEGILLKTWGSLGSKNNQFESLEAINIDKNDKIYVEDSIPLKNGKFKTRTQSFSSDGLFIASDNKPIPSFDKKGNAYRAIVGKQLPNKTYELLLQKTNSSSLIQEWHLPYYPCSKVLSINSRDEVFFTSCAYSDNSNNYSTFNKSHRTLEYISSLYLNKFSTKAGKIVKTTTLYQGENILPPANLAIDDSDNIYTSTFNPSEANQGYGLALLNRDLDFIGMTSTLFYKDISLKDNQINIIYTPLFPKKLSIQVYKPLSNLKPPVLKFVKSTDVRGEVEISWEDKNTDETGFKLQRCICVMAVCSDFKTVTLLKANTSSARLVKSKDYYPGVRYKFRVLAIKDEEESLIYNDFEITLN
jgi:hypothetical protein